MTVTGALSASSSPLEKNYPADEARALPSPMARIEKQFLNSRKAGVR